MSQRFAKQKDKSAIGPRLYCAYCSEKKVYSPCFCCKFLERETKQKIYCRGCSFAHCGNEYEICKTLYFEGIKKYCYTNYGKSVATLEVHVQGKVIDTINFLGKKPLVIGRGRDVDYRIKSMDLARRHCEIISFNNNILIKDCRSKTGTYVNGQKISEMFLKVGDEIRIGPILIKVQRIKQVTMPSQTIPGREEAPIFRAEDYPTGKCAECKKDISQKEMASHMGVYKGSQMYCLQCFSEGAGNFPTIAGYRIIKKLGGGGMGDVYESIQLSMERPVAFKLMRSLEDASEQQVKRFFREARTGRKLNHPNIAGFIDSGKLEGACYIAMEFIYGRDVRFIMEEQGPIDYEEALRIAYYVAKALDYATTRFDIVHRDIKPENILIDRDNIIKLTDFGLAKNLQEAGLSEITKSQTGVGTLFYMAPEQITDARFADKRADIYSLGVTLYEMIAGERPFFATQMMPLVNKIRYEQPRPLSELVFHIPPEVVTLVNKAMEKAPEDRFQTPGEMMKFIEAIIPIN